MLYLTPILIRDPTYVCIGKTKNCSSPLRTLVGIVGNNVWGINEVKKWTDSFVWWHIKLCRIFNAKGSLEGQLCYDLTAEEDKRVHTFPKGISLKVNVIAWLGLKKITYYNVIDQHVNHYTTKTPPHFVHKWISTEIFVEIREIADFRQILKTDLFLLTNFLQLFFLPEAENLMQEN